MSHLTNPDPIRPDGHALPRPHRRKRIFSDVLVNLIKTARAA